MFDSSDPLVTDNRERTALILLHTDEGLTGYGEANANPYAIKATLDSSDGLGGGWDDSIRDILIGSDPSDPRALWNRMLSSTAWSCRNGLGHVARAGVDMALWDLAGKAAGVPSWELLGNLRDDRPLPYVTIYNGPISHEENVTRTLEAVDRALDEGYWALKVEALPNNTRDDHDVVELVSRVKDHIGDDVALLLDVGYRWETFADARECASELETFDLTLLEAPFPPHRIADYRQLRDAISIPLAGCELLTAAIDYLPLIDNDAVDIVQAGTCRTGLSDMDFLARYAARHDKQVATWGWCATTLTTVANNLIGLVHPNVGLLEYAPPELYPGGLLRNKLMVPEPIVQDGHFQLPTRPGLGLELDEEVLSIVRAPDGT